MHTIPPGHERHSKWTPQLGYIQRLQRESKRERDGIWKIVGVGTKKFGMCFIFFYFCDRQLNPHAVYQSTHQNESTLTHRIPPETIDSEC